MTIKDETGNPVNISDIRMGTLTCIDNAPDWNFVSGKDYKVHFDDRDGNKGGYIFGTTGFFGSSDCTWLTELDQMTCDKFVWGK